MENLHLVTNPFDNHLVIEKILEYVQFNELKALRLANSFWNQFASPLLEQKAWIHLNSKNIGDFTDFQNLYNEENNKSTPVKFGNYHLRSVELNLKDGHSSASKFFTQFGPHVEEIVLDKCIFTFQTDAIKLICKLLPHCKVLSISAPQVEVGDVHEDELDSESMQISQNWSIKYLEIILGVDRKKIAWWEQMFKMLPGLKSLNIQCRSINDTTQMLDALMNANPKLTSLTEFSSFLTELNDHHLRQLIHLNVPFSALDLNLCPSVTWAALHDLLATCKKSLKSLKLFHGSLPKESDEFPMEFHGGFPYIVQLNALQSLELIGDMITSFGFLKNLPNLTKLSILNPNNDEEYGPIESMHIECTKEQNGGFVMHKNLHTLSIEYALRPACIRKLGTILAPNLVSISMYLNDDSLRAIISCVSNLEELSILGTDVTDEGLTGIGLEDLLSTPATCDLQTLRKCRQFPYIGDCQRLRKLSLYAQPQENISDYSVHLGFMAAKELTVLDIQLTAITDEGIEILQTKPNLIQLSSKYFVEDGHACKRALHLQQWHCGSDFCDGD